MKAEVKKHKFECKCGKGVIDLTVTIDNKTGTYKWNHCKECYYAPLSVKQLFKLTKIDIDYCKCKWTSFTEREWDGKPVCILCDNELKPCKLSNN